MKIVDPTDVVDQHGNCSAIEVGYMCVVFKEPQRTRVSIHVYEFGDDFIFFAIRSTNDSASRLKSIQRHQFTNISVGYWMEVDYCVIRKLTETDYDEVLRLLAAAFPQAETSMWYNYAAGQHR